jgi:hypothetical protein
MFSASHSPDVRHYQSVRARPAAAKSKTASVQYYSNRTVWFLASGSEPWRLQPHYRADTP